MPRSVERGSGDTQGRLEVPGGWGGGPQGFLGELRGLLPLQVALMSVMAM